jgi:uncharacterized protein (TIGR02391 family)
VDVITERHASTRRPDGPVVGLWVDDWQLEKRLDGLDAPALCVVPWNRADIDQWKANWNPTDLRTGEAAGQAATVGNPVVEAALRSLTVAVNLSTGLSQPSDRAAAVQAFRLLREAGERFEPSEVQAWAVRNGWRPRHARELSEVVQAIVDRRSIRGGRPRWREDIVEHWRRGPVGRRRGRGHGVGVAIVAKVKHPQIDTSVVRGVARVLGDTDTGLTRGEIGELLALCRIPDPAPGTTKWKRLYAALHDKQAHDGASNCVIRFVSEALAPARHVSAPELFAPRQDAVNEVLVLGGLRVRNDGRVAKAKQARTLDEAANLASRLEAELRRRGTHQEVVRYCREELLRNSNYHAVFETTRGVAQRLRDMTGLDVDGAALVDAAFALGEHNSPRVRINALSTETERSEHKGFANLIKGVFGLFRNVTAHAPRIVWPVPENDALDLFTTLSLIHRRLDAADTPGRQGG